ncbi:hypothetical protein BC941DRAFT_438389 [Chlamydoabsidia padenii]|nr:hypothetical protein BC941DRAFT_438389 [Chlamydoabsidia padenii]
MMQKTPTLLLNGATFTDQDNNDSDSNGNNKHQTVSNLITSLLLPSTSHDSLDSITETRPFNEWMSAHRKRALSVPDLGRLYKEWKLYQNTGLDTIKPCHLQVDLLNIQLDSPLKRPAMRVKMGAIKYVSSRSTIPTGDWNEGFVFMVSYHAQLFNTIEFDLYDVPRKYWPKGINHVGKAKLKISRLKGREDVFTTFLPIYEYGNSRRRLPPDTTELIERSGMFKKAMGTIFKKANLIGSVQIRIRYKFQLAEDAAAAVIEQWKHTLHTEQINGISRITTDTQQQVNEFGENRPTLDVIHPLDDTHPCTSSSSSSSERRTSHQTGTNIRNNNSSSTLVRKSSKNKKGNTKRPSLQPSISSSNFKTNDNNSRSQHGRGDLAQDETFINQLFKNQMEKMMTTHIPNEKTSSFSPTGSSSSSTTKYHHRHWRAGFSKKNRNKRQRQKTRCMSFDWWTALLNPNKDEFSARGRRYGFQQNDTEGANKDIITSKNSVNNTKNGDASFPHWQPSVNKEHGRAYRLTRRAKKKAKHIISSVDFGDKSFGSRWMQDSFEVVALAHPVADHLIGLAVKTQTQALVRAIIVLANSFGQGFKVTAFKLVKAMLLLERYYKSLPKQISSTEITDRYLIDAGNHYFRYALVAYGWRGLAYLGLYGQLIRRSGGKSRSNRLAILNYLRVESGDLLGYEYGMREGAAFQPSYFVAVDRPKKNIVLSIRGTWSLYDAITDLVCYYAPWKGGLVHSGMLASAQWFFIHIVPQIFRYIHLHRKYLKGFVITGHSLGGGAASLLTMMVADELKTLRKLAENPDFNLQCYSYAPVALVSYDLASQYDQYIHSFIVQDDIVGRLSYGTALKLKELILDTISSYEALGGMAKVLTNSKSRKLLFEIIDKCRTLIFQTSTFDSPPVLYIPGKVIHIRRRRVKRFGGGNNKGKTTTAHMSKHIPGASRPLYSVHLGNRQICEEMIVTKTAILDHTIGAYQEAFDKLSAMHPALLYPSNLIG